MLYLHILSNYILYTQYLFLVKTTKKHLIYAHQHSSQLCCTASGSDVHLVSCHSYDGNHWKHEE